MFALLHGDLVSALGAALGVLQGDAADSGFGPLPEYGVFLPAHKAVRDEPGVQAPLIR